MSNTKHTPGPVGRYRLRLVSEETGYESTADGSCTPEQYGAAIASLHGQPTPLERQMLEALKEAAVLIDGWADDDAEWLRLGAKYSKSGDEFGATEKDVSRGVIATIRAAISKATGGAR